MVTYQYTDNPKDLADCRLIIVAVPTPIGGFNGRMNIEYWWKSLRSVLLY
jgi:UDP-N-acetyl-D-mannosaminuronate dehydrogenase